MNEVIKKKKNSIQRITDSNFYFLIFFSTEIVVSFVNSQTHA